MTFLSLSSQCSKDVEGGEGKELIEGKAAEKNPEEKEGEEGKQDSNRRSEEELDKVKAEKAADSASTGSEKKDPEKGEEDKKGEGEKACRVRDFREWELRKKLALCGIITGVILLLVVIILIACAAGGVSNDARISGKYVETHTTCGPVEG